MDSSLDRHIVSQSECRIPLNLPRVQALIRHYEKIPQNEISPAIRGGSSRTQCLPQILGASSVIGQRSNSPNILPLINTLQGCKPERLNMIPDDLVNAPMTGFAVEDSPLLTSTMPMAPAASSASSKIITPLSTADNITELRSLENTQKISELEMTVPNMCKLKTGVEQEVPDLSSNIQDLIDRKRSIQKDLENTRMRMEQKHRQQQREKHILSAEVEKLQDELDNLRKKLEQTCSEGSSSNIRLNANNPLVLQRKIGDLCSQIQDLQETNRAAVAKLAISEKKIKELVAENEKIQRAKCLHHQRTKEENRRLHHELTRLKEQQYYSYTEVIKLRFEVELQRVHEDIRNIRTQQKEEIIELWKGIERLDKRIRIQSHDSLISSNLASREISDELRHPESAPPIQTGTSYLSSSYHDTRPATITNLGQSLEPNKRNRTMNKNRDEKEAIQHASISTSAIKTGTSYPPSTYSDSSLTTSTHQRQSLEPNKNEQDREMDRIRDEDDEILHPSISALPTMNGTSYLSSTYPCSSLATGIYRRETLEPNNDKRGREMDINSDKKQDAQHLSISAQTAKPGTSYPSSTDPNNSPPASTHQRQPLEPNNNKLGGELESSRVQQFINTDNSSLVEVESLPVFKGPLCLIDTGKDRKLAINDNVLNQIAMIPSQLNVIAIAGLYRTGKSYLLSRLAGVKKGIGFALGCTIESKTKGIWAWCRPHPKRRDEVLLLLDTEGLGDIRKGDKNHDNWILALATLLSNTIVYNAKGNFDQDTLEQLKDIKHVQVSNNRESKKDNGDFDLFFPQFILALRDFTLTLESNNGKITSDQYLEECLDLRNSSSKSDDKYNEPRMCIRKYFQKRKCFTFDRPGGKDTLKNLESLTDDDLSKDFIKDSELFCNFVLCESHPKKLDSVQTIRGRMFATLTRTYVEAIRNDKIPCIENALETMAQIENFKAVEVSVAQYLTRMHNTVQLPVPSDKVLSDAHHSCVEEAIALFLSKAVYDRDQTYQKQANEKIRTNYENLKRENGQISKSKCQQALAQLNKTIENNIKQQVYIRAGGYNRYQQDITEIKDKYEKLSDLGCKKQETLDEYLASKWTEGHIFLQADKNVKETEKKAEFERQKALESERRMEEAVRLSQVEKQKIEDERRQFTENIRQLERKQEEDFKQIKEENERVITERLKEQKRLLKEGFVNEASKLEQAIEKLRQSNQPPTVINNTKLCSIQ